MVSKGIKSVTLWIGKKSFQVDFKIMPLPQQVDVILGMEFFIQENAWLNPRSKRILIQDTDASTFEVLTSMLTDTWSDSDDTDTKSNSTVPGTGVERQFL